MKCKDSDFKYQAFPNGLQLEEGVERAGEWWDTTGREVIAKLSESNPLDGDEQAEVGKGMMSGAKFMTLTTAEQHKILMAWYQEQGRFL